MTESRPAFYARVGTTRSDLLALLHLPYTGWHLSYVAFGAALAPDLSLVRLAGVLAAFGLGTGVAAHAFDEWNGRPLGTRLHDRTLLTLGIAGVAGGGGIAVLGAVAVSPWMLAWGAAAVVLMLGYTLEVPRMLHSDTGFALAWGGFPVIAGYWVQTEGMSIAALLVAFAAVLLSLAQRRLSTPARFVRRRTMHASVSFETTTDVSQWSREYLLSTWESPLKLMAGTSITLAVGLTVMRL